MKDLLINPFFANIDITNIKIDNAPDLKALQEKAFKQSVAKDVEKSTKVFTFKESMNIALVPLIVIEVAWHYASIVLDNAAILKIEETKKLCRAMKFARKAYLVMCKKDLDYNHIKRLNIIKDDFIQKCASDLNVIWFSVSNELKKNYKTIEYIDEIRTNAYMSLLMMDVLDLHNKRMDKLIKEKMGHCNSYRNPFLNAMREGMRAFAFPADISTKNNVVLSMAIMQKNLAKIDYDAK